MNGTFHANELVLKDGKTYPVVGGRLRVAHADNEKMTMTTTLLDFKHLELAVVKVDLETSKGHYTAHGAASVEKDLERLGSLLELAETRAIARALRFAGYGVEFTGSEEIPDEGSRDLGDASATKEAKEAEFEPLTRAQRHAIEKIAVLNRWNVVESCRRILANPGIQSLDDLSKSEASTVIGRMKGALDKAA